MDAEEVALGVFEPRRLLRAEHADVVDGLEVGLVVILEHHVGLLELADAVGDVAHLNADRRVVGLGALGFGKQRQGAAAHRIDELAVGAHATGREAEAALVEGAGAGHVLDGEHVVTEEVDSMGGPFCAVGPAVTAWHAA